MATLNVTVKVEGPVSGPSFITTPGPTTRTIEQTGSNTIAASQVIGTTAEALVLGEVTSGGNTLGVLSVTNTSTANYVQLSYGDSAGTNFADKIITRIPKSSTVLIVAEANTVYAKANTAACTVIVDAWQL